MSLSDNRLVVIMAAKYQLYKDKSGKYRFRLVAENGRTIATGEAYERRTSCLNGIESVKKNRGSSIEDTTIESPKIPFPKYQIFVDKSGEYRFNLSASNGEVVASSEGYSNKDGCLNGINAVRRIGNSEIEDLTAIAAEKKEETPITEPEPTVVAQEEVAPSKQPEPEDTYKEEDNKISWPAAAATPSKEITTSRSEIHTAQKGNIGLALAVLVIGLVVGIILLAVGLGFGGILGAADVTARLLMQVFGWLLIFGSILFFFAKK